jgi:hypothetical protein
VREWQGAGAVGARWASQERRRGGNGARRGWLKEGEGRKGKKGKEERKRKGEKKRKEEKRKQKERRKRKEEKKIGIGKEKEKKHEKCLEILENC